MKGIGLLNEKSLHASLKEWYAEPGDRFEVTVDGYVIDIVQGDLLLEIQTGNFSAIKAKLTNLVSEHKIRLVYPIALEKWIIKLAKNGVDEAIRRKSPKKGRVEDLFWEMVSFPRLIENPNFSLEVLLIREDELRRYRGKQKWRRREWVIEERQLLEVVERKMFEDQRDLLTLIPEKFEEPFTTKDIAEALGIKIQLAQKMAYCLRETSVIGFKGKRGRANLYEVVDSQYSLK